MKRLNPGECEDQNESHRWVVDPPTQVCAHCGRHRAHPYECDHVLALAADGTATVCVKCAETTSPCPELAVAVKAYDTAIRECANKPHKMVSFCTAQGETLDALYLHMIALAELE